MFSSKVILMILKLIFRRVPRVIVLLLLFSCTSTLYIAPKQVDCIGASDQRCYLIRRSTEGNWIMHYQDIVGLDYELGFSYKIKVRKENIKNPPLDGATYKYHIVDILEKKDVTESVALEDLLNKQWSLEYLKWQGTQYEIESKGPTLKFENDGKISGNGGCNNFFSTFILHGRTIEFGEIGTTRMMCEGAMELEGTYLKALDHEIRAIFNENKLVLYSDGGNKMIFGYK